MAQAASIAVASHCSANSLPPEVSQYTHVLQGQLSRRSIMFMISNKCVGQSAHIIKLRERLHIVF